MKMYKSVQVQSVKYSRPYGQHCVVGYHIVVFDIILWHYIIIIIIEKAGHIYYENVHFPSAS